MRSVGVLEEIFGPNVGRTHRLGLPLMGIGRSVRSDIQLPHESVSRSHAEIVVHDDAFFVRDKASRNGTFLNDTRVDERELRAGDVLTIGKVLLRFRVAADDGEPGGAHGGDGGAPPTSTPPAASAPLWRPVVRS
jgi:pSer/pThr/pTyr-binding forkhead associated (FHA) protein